MTGFRNALAVFKIAAQRVPGYKRFLAEHGFRADSVSSYADFQKIPVMDKHGYLYRTPYPDQWIDRRVPPMIHVSSGSSGRPTFWFRDDHHEEWGGYIHERIFRDIFKIDRDTPTLVIICFAMGVWVAGTYTLAACRSVARRGYKLSIVTPGIEIEDVFQVLKKLAPNFPKVILAGYPPFLMDIITEAKRRGVLIKRGLKVLAAAGVFSEEWRDAFLALLGRADSFGTLLNVYGSADAGVMGHETPLSIFLRREAFKDKRLHRELFGASVIIPGLYQFDPRFIFLEELGGELLVTTATAVPLVRYNIHDIGRVLQYGEMVRLLSEFGLCERAKRRELEKWKLPFVVVKGRTDVAVMFYALNIYPEHLKQGVEDDVLAKHLTGSFAVYTKNVFRNQNQRLCIWLELAPGARPGENFKNLCRDVIVSHLNKSNAEFRKLVRSIGKDALPHISFFPYQDSRFTSLPAQGMVCIKGKKPRIVL